MKKVVNAKANYEKPQVEVVEMESGQNFCQNVITQSAGAAINSVKGDRFHMHENVYEDFNTSGETHWGETF